MDSFIINIGFVANSAIVLQADSMWRRSGVRSSVSGVGTAITTMSHSLTSLPSLDARYVPCLISDDKSEVDIPSI